MDAVPYRAVEFAQDQTITKSDMDQLQANYTYLWENTPRGSFMRASGDLLEVRTVVVCGRSFIKKSNKQDTAGAVVRFGKTFAPKCHPHVTTGVVADKEKRIFCTITGPGGKATPDASGFEIKVNVAADKKKDDHIKKGFWIHWSALGYRQDDINEF